MKSPRTVLVGLGLSVIVAMGWSTRAKAESPHDTLTEWTMPFADLTPLWIAAAGGNIVFSNFDVVGYVGRLEPASGSVTRWQTPYTPVTPSAIAVRPSDGAVFLTGGFEGEIGQLDLGTGVLRRWPMPASEGVRPAGPFYLTVARDGTVLFLAFDTSVAVAYVGRLDTATGSVRLWAIPGSAEMFLWQLALGPGETVFGNFSGFGPHGLFRLDMATGAFTTWSTGTVEPVDSIATDAGGQVYYQQIGGSEWGISRLEPETGGLTQWAATPGFSDRMVFSDGRALFGDLGSVVALDVSHPGRSSTLSPSPATSVAPASLTTSPSEQALVSETAPAGVQISPIFRQHGGAYDTWATGSAKDVASTASSPDVYFSDGSELRRIGRITRN